jgi:hypothetical protein
MPREHALPPSDGALRHQALQVPRLRDDLRQVLTFSLRFFPYVSQSALLHGVNGGFELARASQRKMMSG